MVKKGNKSRQLNDAGMFKEFITSALFENDEIRNMILGKEVSSDKKTQIDVFKKKVHSHLFVDDTVLETDTFIFYDVYIPYANSTIKTNKLIIYCICHRDILDNYTLDGYHGNRVDILSELIEETLYDDEIRKKFGIGELSVEGVNIYNATRFYGRELRFDIPNFR